MAATGFTPVYLYASGTAGHIPLAANLTNTTNGSEIALNYADGNLFFKNSSNSVITTPLLQASSSQSGWLSSTDWSTFNGKQAALVSGTNIKTVSGVSLLGSGDVGTIGTSYGGTGLTSFTSGGVLYASSTSALTTGTALSFDGTNLGIGTNNPSSYGKLAVIGGYVVANGAGTFDPEYRLSGASGGVTRNYAMGTDGSQRLYFYDYTASAYRFVIDSSGNVGIGTISPSSYGNFAVYASVAGTVTSTIINADTNASSQTTFALVKNTDVLRMTTLYGIGIIGSQSNMPVYIETNSTERMRFFTSGGVSIGNQTDPGAGNLNVNSKAFIGTAINQGTLNLGGSYANMGAYASTYHVDSSYPTLSIANSGTVDFSSFSGMIVANNNTSGAVTIYLCGGGSTTAVGSVGSQVGTMAYNSGVAGYRWTNNSGGTVIVTFCIIRTRQTA